MGLCSTPPCSPSPSSMSSRPTSLANLTTRIGSSCTYLLQFTSGKASDLHDSPLRVFHSIFCNRVILLLGKQRSYSSGVLATLAKADLNENITPAMRASAAHRMRRPITSAMDPHTERSTFQDLDDGDPAFTLRTVDEEQSAREQHEMETYYERRRKDRFDQY